MKASVHRSLYVWVAAAVAVIGLAIWSPPSLAANATVSPAATSPDQAEYRLGSGDKIRVIVYGEETLSGEFLIGGNGRASLPLIGEVQAAGLTTKAFQDEVQTALKDGYLREPRVNVEVLNFRPFYILGEISKPGEYPYTDGLTVLNAVAVSGGFTYRANKGRVFIRHKNETQEQGVPLTTTALVAPGDTIRIGERLF